MRLKILAQLTALVAFVTLAGCAFHAAPYAMYDGTPELANTTVFSAVDYRHEEYPGIEAQYSTIGIRQVDGKEPSCWQNGCPVWVRVLPGAHTFRVRIATDIKLVWHEIAYRQAELEIEVKDMKPRHVYVAHYRYSIDEQRIIADINDLGENPEFGISLGLNGVNRKYHRVNF